ncbi:MAG: hypothetical protein ACXW4B_00065 [Micavibrio sp.]
MEIYMFRRAFSLLIIPFVFGIQSANAQSGFRFESISDLEQMNLHIRQNHPLGSPKEDLQNAFVQNGQATLIPHPHKEGVEKYIYDINLCGYYIWRWNISADYDASGKLMQAYINGTTVFPEGPQKAEIPKTAEEGKNAKILKGQRPRPEASKGESSLAFLLFDRDGNIKTIDDQALIGGGPSRANPANMGTMIIYKEVDPWRSIFDFDPAKTIANYPDCKEADALHAAMRAKEKATNTGQMIDTIIEKTVKPE